jgi:phosphoglycolate phosphatase
LLVLFDIDATMITTGGAGMRAMVRAGQRLFGPGFTAEGVPVAGRLDPLIMGEMMDRSGVPRSAEAFARFRAEYSAELAREMDPAKGRALPGVLDLLGSLSDHPRITRGVLTGNFEETGSLKLRLCGIDPAWFAVAAWGDESPHDPPAREHLPPVAVGRYRERFARELPAHHVVVIGDTPHDIACAHAHGHRCLAVATGSFSAEQLAAADRVVESLADTRDILRWLADGGA